MREYLGNGVCDDITNRESCDFDGGDCCLHKINQSYCFKCACHANPGGQGVSIQTYYNDYYDYLGNIF